jgi:hypothetical protein
MRVEGNSYGSQRTRCGALSYPLQNQPVTAMHSIEVSYADNGRAETVGDFTEAVKDEHGQISNGMCNPS